MNKEELVHKVAKKAKMPKTTTTAILTIIMDQIEQTVASGKRATFVGFGTFFPHKRPARNGRNPLNGKTIKIPAKTVPVFSPGKKFRELVNTEKKK